MDKREQLGRNVEALHKKTCLYQRTSRTRDHKGISHGGFPLVLHRRNDNVFRKCICGWKTLVSACRPFLRTRLMWHPPICPTPPLFTTEYAYFFLHFAYSEIYTRYCCVTFSMSRAVSWVKVWGNQGDVSFLHGAHLTLILLLCKLNKQSKLNIFKWKKITIIKNDETQSNICLILETEHDSFL